MMRQPCLDCTMKHLGEAAIFDMEVQQGYPEFAIYVIGSLAHASTEVHKAHVPLALLIREHRLRWMEDHKYDVPYEALGTFVTLLSQLDPDVGAEAKIPEDCTVGIHGQMSGDTRT